MTRGILKNAKDDAAYRTQSPKEVSIEPLDRHQVIENTRLNAQMRHQNQTDTTQQQLEGDLPSHLKWDEGNLLVNEMEKTPKMKIDEPKTPYEGGFDPNNDYYKLEPIEGLDDGMDDTQIKPDEVEVLVDPAAAEEEQRAQEPDEVNIEDDISEFERKRRMHYKTEGNPLHHIIADEDDDEE